MSDPTPKARRLPRNFHRTFIPERQYLNAMLSYAASGKSGTPQEISADTGIPTGVSSGKVPAILDYCRGMGLVTLGRVAHSGTKRPELTAFGRVVLLEDPYFKEAITQWVAHFHLCSSRHGADVWYQTFYAGAPTLGMNFTREQLEEHLALTYGTEQAGLIGPLIRMYEEEASFASCGVLSAKANAISRRPAPLADEFGRGYGAWVLGLLTECFPGVGQVTVTELDAAAGWRTIPGWDSGSLQEALALVERKGLLHVDRQMDPWIVRAATTTDDAWRRIYDDLL